MTATFPTRSGVDVMFSSGATFADGVYCLRHPRDERNEVDDRADDDPLHARDRGRPHRRTGGTGAAALTEHALLRRQLERLHESALPDR
jgi:hypothetical protein